MDFEVVDLVLSAWGEPGGGGEGTRGSGAGGSGDTTRHEQRLSEVFRVQVSSKCTEEAVVFIYISGFQFPFEVK